MALNGPFIFPENTQPISPFLWLCLLEEDAKLAKQIQVMLPHYLTGLTKVQVQHHHIGFAKAPHDDLTFQTNRPNYDFSVCEDEPGHFQFEECTNYGIIFLNHGCFYCLLAKHTDELTRDAGYCLTRIEKSVNPQRNEVYFTVTPFLKHA